ncbi:MAG: phosphatase PAP2 family protein [Pseudomonadota bacterium]
MERRWASSAPLRFIEARLTPGGEFGLHLTVGVALMIAAALAFGEIAEAVMEQTGLTVFDVQVSQWLHLHAVPALTTCMLAITNLHSLAGMVVLSLLLAGYFIRRRALYWLLALAVAVPGGMLINVLLKYVYQRARPVFETPLLTLQTYSFPSGHTAAATLFYGLLAAYCVMTLRSRRLRVALVTGAVSMVALVGFSRVYLGVHYPSDVLAAVLESGGWLAVCITACSTLRRRRALKGAPS